MEQQVIVALPCGIPDPTKGRWINQVRLRRLDGLDERLLAELSHMPLHSRVLAFLERVASFEEEGNTAELLRKLNLGDRAALMLHVRRFELGDNIDCNISCTKCDKVMSVLLSAAKLLGTRHPELSASYGIKAGGFNLLVKPLTALDQDLLLNAKGNEEDLRQTLARSCIASSDPALPEKLPDQVIEAIELKLDQVDPLCNIMLDLSCPECCHEFRASFNVEDFILRELGIAYMNDLESEVHWLALHYHWNENEILSLPVRRRQRYISLINSTLAGGVST